MDLFFKLLTPKLLIVYGPMAVMCVALGVALSYLWKRHEELHTQRLLDMTRMKDEYISLVHQVEKTLDILISVIDRRKK